MFIQSNCYFSVIYIISMYAILLLFLRRALLANFSFLIEVTLMVDGRYLSPRMGIWVGLGLREAWQGK